MKKTVLILFFWIFVLQQGCRNTQTEPSEDNVSSIVDLAERLVIIKEEDHDIIRILNPWQGSSNTVLEYCLVKRGDRIPDGVDSSTKIFVPVQNVICMSVTHLAMLAALGETGSVSAVSGAGLVYSPELRKVIERGKIPDVGYETSLNNELIIKISPDVIFMYGIGGESAAWSGKIGEMGIKVVYVGDYLEEDPLARAEWIKLFGALYLKDELADSIFDNECESYKAIKSKALRTTKKPKVLLGLPYKDSWYISPGNSYISRIVSDAGGDYLWSDAVSQESMPLSLENVYVKALAADFWLNTGTAASTEDIAAIDPRFAELPCFKKGNLYNNNNRLTSTGGNDYWEMGSVYPHLVLKDIAVILHPELFSADEQLYFYRKLQ